MPNHNLTDPELLSDVAEIEQSCGGRLCFALENLQTGEICGYRAEERCKTASIIKFPILVHVALAVSEGNLDWEQPLVLTDAEKVGGSGVLTQLGAGLTLTLRDACVLMTIVSDNTATNMVIESIGVETVNARMRALGFEVTTLFRKSYSEDTEASRPYGLGVTTPMEMCRLVTLVETRASGGDAACREILEIMKHQAYRDCIPRYLPETWSYAGKTGSIDAARNDVGLVTTEAGAKYALAVFIQDLTTVLWTADNPGQVAIAQLARRLLVA